MKNKLTAKEYLIMFLTFLKLGSLSIGGGNTMVSMLEGELIEKKKWLTFEELAEMIGVAEVTPGPIAINIATYIGYKRGGILGAIMTTLGILIPPVICMFLIATFLGSLMKYDFINYIMMGVKAAVVLLLGTVAFNLIRKTKLDLFGIITIITVFAINIVFTIFPNKYFSVIYLVLLGAFLGLLIYGIIPKHKEKKEAKK